MKFFFARFPLGIYVCTLLLPVCVLEKAGGGLQCDKQAGWQPAQIRPRKKIVSYNGPEINRVGRTELTKKFFIIFLFKNVCFMHVF